MRKQIRCIVLVLVLCLIFSATGMVATADESVDGILILQDFPFESADPEMLTAYFCMDARGFIKALAFENAGTQSRVGRQLFHSQDEQTLSCVQHLLAQSTNNTGQLFKTRSEKNLVAALDYHQALSSAFRSSYYTDVEALFSKAVNAIGIDQYTEDLGYHLYTDPYSFVVALSELEQEDQDSILFQLTPLNGTVRSTLLKDIVLAALGTIEPDSPGLELTEPATQGQPFSIYTNEQLELLSAIAECIKDVPPRIDYQEPIPEELTQWQANPVVPRTDFYPMLIRIANSDSSVDFEYLIAEEVGPFIQNLAPLEQPASRNRVAKALLGKWETSQTWPYIRCVLFGIHSYLLYGNPDKAQTTAANEFMYALLRSTAYKWETEPGFSQYFAPPEGGSPYSSDIVVYHLSINACWYPKDFIAAYVGATRTYQDLASYNVKTKLESPARQALIDTLYDLQSDETLSDTELEALQTFLDYQGSGVNPMYPYGVDPNAPPPTEPTDPTETTAPTETTVPTETEPAAQDSSEDTPSDGNRSTRLLSTVFLCIGAFAVGVPIGIYYVNRKKQPIKEEKDAVPPPPDEEDFLW